MSGADKSGDCAVEFPSGAIHNGHVCLDRLEATYSFECEAGPLRLCSDWQTLKQCFEHLAQVSVPSYARAITQANETIKRLEAAEDRWAITHIHTLKRAQDAEAEITAAQERIGELTEALEEARLGLNDAMVGMKLPERNDAYVRAREHMNAVEAALAQGGGGG